MKIACLVLLAFMLASPALAAPDNAASGSLFFTPEEAATVESLAAQAARPDMPPVLRLNALLYYGPKNWVFWIGGMRFTPDSGHPGIRVLGVKPEEVRLQLEGASGDATRAITLEPHQAFDTATGAVMESAP